MRISGFGALFVVIAAGSTFAFAGERAFVDGYLWSAGFGAPPRFPFVADVDGDRFADLLCVYPPGPCIIDVAINVGCQKSLFPNQARTNFGHDAVAAGFGRVMNPAAVDVIELMPDGQLLIAHDFDKETRLFKSETAWCKLAEMPLEPRLVVADLDGDGRDDVLVMGKSGAGTLVLNGESPRSSAVTLAAEIATICSGRFVGPKAEARGKQLVWLSGDGKLFRARYVDGRFEPVVIESAQTHKADEPLCVGDFDGDGADEVIVGSTLYRVDSNDDGKFVARDIVELHFDKASMLFAADMNGDGRDDVIRFRRDGEKHYGYDILVYLSIDPKSDDPDFDGLATAREIELGTDPLNRDSDGDGLLDGWEVNGFRGLDLAAAGASPLHRDIFVEIQRIADVDEAALHREMDRSVAYYAGLAVENPDHKPGIALHPIYTEALANTEWKDDGWGGLGNRHFPQEHRGLHHWMVTTNSGGGQSSQNADMGSFGVHAGFATFLHEFGHQLGLDHTGHWGPGWNPLYPSLMNYCYSYQLGGRGENVAYSRGEFASVVLDESKLSERLPFKYEKLAFLAGPPYYFHLQADGDATLIDWNWNGKFDAEPVRADINYGYSTSAGDRKQVDTTFGAAALCAFQDQLFVYYVREDRSLAARKYLGKEQWDEPVVIVEKGVTGDPFAVEAAEETYLFVPTERGVEYRRGRPPQFGRPAVIPESKDAAVSAAYFHERVVAFLHDSQSQVVRYLVIDQEQCGPTHDLAVKSLVPPGPAIDAHHDELLLGIAQDDGKMTSRFRIARFKLENATAPSQSAGAPQLAAGAGPTAVETAAAPESQNSNQAAGNPANASTIAASMPATSAHDPADCVLNMTELAWLGPRDGQWRGSGRPSLVFEHPPQSHDPAATKPAVVPPPAANATLHYMVQGLTSKQTPNSGMWDIMTVGDRNKDDGWLCKRLYDEWTTTESTIAAAWFDDDIVFAFRWFGSAPSLGPNRLLIGHFGTGLDREPMGDFDDVGFIVNFGMQHSILHFATR